MIAAAALLVLSVDAAMSVPRISPLFSWSTLPVAFHSSSSHSLFTSAQISELARYAMVTLEKYHDIDNVAPHATLIPPYTASTYALLIYPRCWCISRRPAATARCHCAYIDVHICCLAAALSHCDSFNASYLLFGTCTLMNARARARTQAPNGLYNCQNGSDLSKCGCCAEDGIVATARAIKLINPAVVTVAYLHTANS